MAVDYFKILVADDEDTIRLSFKLILEKEGLTADIVQGGKEALNLLGRNKYDLAFIDLMMPEIGGLDVLKIIKENYPLTKVIIITGFGTVNTAVEAMKYGASDFIQKPFMPEDIRQVLKKYLVDKADKKKRTGRLKFIRNGQVETIIGESPPMLEVYDLVYKVAPTDSTVLITGETGTGKELIAKAIHYNSQRRDKPYLTVDCCSLVETLFESELFGHVKGSFTGADVTKHGSLELANGGTFFFDEIGNISLNIQAKILRAIQEKEIKRVGGTDMIKVDVRVIAATNMDLKKAVAEGIFRKDLYYRLSVIPIHLPPLRDRSEDILSLAEHFLEKYNQKRKRNLAGFSDDVKNVFLKYHWPGNVRELENMVERAVVVEEGRKITMSSLPAHLGKLSLAKVQKDTSAKTLSELEKEHIAQVLESTNWNRSKSAKILGIDRKTLYDKIRRYEIEKS